MRQYDVHKQYKNRRREKKRNVEVISTNWSRLLSRPLLIICWDDDRDFLTVLQLWPLFHNFVEAFVGEWCSQGPDRQFFFWLPRVGSRSEPLGSSEPLPYPMHFLRWGIFSSGWGSPRCHWISPSPFSSVLIHLRPPDIDDQWGSSKLVRLRDSTSDNRLNLYTWYCNQSTVGNIRKYHVNILGIFRRPIPAWCHAEKCSRWYQILSLHKIGKILADTKAAVLEVMFSRLTVNTTGNVLFSHLCDEGLRSSVDFCGFHFVDQDSGPLDDKVF